MDLRELESAVSDGAVDTVLPAMTDMQDRLQGKRITARHFLAATRMELARDLCAGSAVDAAVTDRERVRGFERL